VWSNDVKELFIVKAPKVRGRPELVYTHPIQSHQHKQIKEKMNKENQQKEEAKEKLREKFSGVGSSMVVVDYEDG